MAFDDFKKKLEDTDSSEHKALLDHCKNLIEMSRSEMCKHYSRWDEHDAVFRSRRKPDREDRNAVAKGQPAKLLVPLTFSQIMTFVAFNVTTLTQKKRFYELEPTGTEDNPLAEPMEQILERDVRRNTWTSFLVQFFLDIGRFAVGAAELCWKEDYRMMRVPRTETKVGAFGTETETSSNDFEKIPTFVGNKLYPVSPYRIFPDTRLPLTRYQDGEFCGSEDMFSMSGLRADASLINLDKVPKMSEDMMKSRRERSRIEEMPTRKNPNMGSGGPGTDPDSFVKSGPVVITKLYVDIIPKHFESGDKGVSLGDETFPIRYLVWYANDQTIVRFEEAYCLHCKFPYIISQFLPDQHQTINEGLADVCDQITNLITWLINAHVTSQRNSVESKWVVDPQGIDVKSLESRSPYIFMKKSASGTDVSRYIKQFVTTDTTANVMQDVGSLDMMLEKITGFAGMMQGQHSTGRRSATQDRVVAQGGAARGKTTLGGIWDTSFEPLGKMLIANNRQEMDFETFQRILGERGTEELFVLFKSDPISIATTEDFFVFDGTIPSEKAFLAQSLQEILMTIMSNPEVAMVLGFGQEAVRSLFEQVYNLRGVTAARLPTQTPMPVQGPVPPNVVPGPPAINSAVS